LQWLILLFLSYYHSLKVRIRVQAPISLLHPVLHFPHPLSNKLSNHSLKVFGAIIPRESITTEELLISTTLI